MVRLKGVSYIMYLWVTMVQKPRWTEKEINFLEVAYPKCSSHELAGFLNRSPKAIRVKASSLGLHVLERFYGSPKLVKQFSPSSQLAYLIGAVLGDGSVFHYGKNYWVTVSATDYGFIYTVQQCFLTIINKLPKISRVDQKRISLHCKKHIFRIQVANKSLFALLSKPLKELKPFIEAYRADFLRGFFDAEGSAWFVDRKIKTKTVVKNGVTHYVNRHSREAVIKYCNTNKELLEYVRQLLLSLLVFPAPKMFVTKGNLCEDPKPCYNLHIYRKESVKRFMRLVGASIARKRLLL